MSQIHPSGNQPNEEEEGEEEEKVVKKKKAYRVDRGVGEEVRETSYNLLYQFILIDLYGKSSFSMKN